MKTCKCGKNNWKWQLDYDLTSWIRCADCKDNMFDNGIGVILITWKYMDIDFSLKDILVHNNHHCWFCRLKTKLKSFLK